MQSVGLLQEAQQQSGLDVVLQSDFRGSAALQPLFPSLGHTDQQIHNVNLHQPQLCTVLAREAQGHEAGHELDILVLEPLSANDLRQAQCVTARTTALRMLGSKQKAQP